MSELQSIRFTFKRIVTEQFAVIDGIFRSGQPVTVLCNLDFSFSDEKAIIEINVNFSFSQEEKTFVKLSVSCFFNIAEEDWKSINRENESKFVLSKNHALHLGSLVVSLARGILHAKIENQPFHLIVLPPINLHEIIEGDIVALKTEKNIEESL
jgi:hypothetical protein